MTTPACRTCTEPASSQVHRDIDPTAVRGPWDIPHHPYAAPDTVWRLAPGACAAWLDPSGRWFVYNRDAAWIARDLTLPTDPREHHRDQERAFYTAAEMLRYIAARP